MDDGRASFNAFATLLQLLRLARRAQTREAFGFTVVNETRRLLPFRQAVLVLGDGRSLRVAAVSGAALIDRQAPMVRWLERVLPMIAASAAVAGTGSPAPAGGAVPAVRPVDAGAVPEAERADWAEWCAPHGLWCPLRDREDRLLGGLWLTREQPWSEAERLLADELAEGYATAWLALDRRRRLVPRARRWLVVAGVAAVLAAVALIPVRLSTLAPATVAPIDPAVVSAPITGVIARFHVTPNQPVTAGQPLFSFEDIELRARRDVAQRTLAVAEAEWRRAAQGAFADPASSAQVAILAAQVELRHAELGYAEEQLSRVTVRADTAGIAVFTDANDWIGRPVTTGERILAIADPGAAEVDIRLPAADAIVLSEGAEVSLFLDVDPVHPLAATLTYASYQAEPGPDGVLAFRLKAHFTEGTPLPRLGLRGTAKVYGAEVPLAYYLLRRPLAALRQAIGF